jgi:hypothetical protein
VTRSPWEARQTHWVRSPITTRHSQVGLLLVTLLWGLSYCMPTGLRIVWSEVFPPDLERWSFIPMWGYGAGMVAGCITALSGERMILSANGLSRAGWFFSFLAHTVLCAIYFTLAVAALVYGIREVGQTGVWSAAAIISALSRPGLWIFIGHQHLGYARLPPPDFPTKPQREHGRHRE